jgi:hypothetical protein
MDRQLPDDELGMLQRIYGIKHHLLWPGQYTLKELMIAALLFCLGCSVIGTCVQLQGPKQKKPLPGTSVYTPPPPSYPDSSPPRSLTPEEQEEESLAAGFVCFALLFVLGGVVVLIYLIDIANRQR